MPTSIWPGIFCFFVKTLGPCARLVVVILGLQVSVRRHAHLGALHRLSLTYFNRLVRGILLKGNDWADLWPNIWPLMVFTVVVMTFAVVFYRRTLD